MLVLGTTALSAACDDAEVPQPCSDIPPGGCPLSHGVACEDASCAAIYACRAGNVWELQQMCPGHDASASEPAEASAPDVGSDVSLAYDAAIDAPPGAFGGPGCGTMQDPDCALGLALACPSDCCGCEDLFVCNAGAWDLWGSCGDGGVLQSGPR